MVKDTFIDQHLRQVRATIARTGDNIGAAKQRIAAGAERLRHTHTLLARLGDPLAFGRRPKAPPGETEKTRAPARPASPRKPPR